MEGRQEGGGGRRREGGGVGGKVTRRSLAARKPPAATPYDRPRPSGEGGEASRRRGWHEGDGGGRGGWFSKAKLLLSPASRVLPSVFSSFVAPASSPSHSDDLASPCSPGAPLEVEQDSHVDMTKQVLNSQGSHLIETVSSARDNHPENHCKTNECTRGREGNTHDGIGFADIERRLKQKTFTRDESNRLIELLHSRTTDLAEDDKCGVGFLTYDAGNACDQKYMRKSIEEKKPVQINHRVHKEPVFDKVGTSPVEIAKAFMESRSLASHRDLYGICWPGAVVQSDHSYFTPQSQKGRAGLHSLSQTPCPGESFQRPLTFTKFQSTSERCPKLPFTAWQRSPTPVFGADKKRSASPGDGQTAVLPILGLEQKNMTMSSSKGATPYNSAGFRTSLSARSDVFRGSSSTAQRNLESGSSIVKQPATCTENDSLKTAAGLSRVHPRSSEVARKILEHLDRTIPFPQDKLLELKFPIEKRASLQAGVTKMLDGQDNKPSPSYTSTSILLGDAIRGHAEVPKDFVFPSGGDIGDKSRPSCDHPRANEEGILSFNTRVTNSTVPQMQRSQPQTSKEQCWSFPHDGFGFAFNASVPSNASSEHLLMPINSSSSKEETNPSFSFGIPAIGSRLIFSFGPVHGSSSITFADGPIPQFRFGSDDTSRLSFRPFVNDPVSCQSLM